VGAGVAVGTVVGPGVPVPILMSPAEFTVIYPTFEVLVCEITNSQIVPSGRFVPCPSALKFKMPGFEIVILGGKFTSFTRMGERVAQLA
jgi:hypothetical protein